MVNFLQIIPEVHCDHAFVTSCHRVDVHVYMCICRPNTDVCRDRLVTAREEMATSSITTLSTRRLWVQRSCLALKSVFAQKKSLSRHNKTVNTHTAIAEIDTAVRGTLEATLSNKDRFALQACLKTCYQTHVINRCDCADSTLAVPSGNAACASDDGKIFLLRIYFPVHEQSHYFVVFYLYSLCQSVHCVRVLFLWHQHH